jgi:hypothetical protein
LEQMYQEGELLKKLIKMKNLFLQISGQPDWETCRRMFPEETDSKILNYWAEKLTDQVRMTDQYHTKIFSFFVNEHQECRTAIPVSFFPLEVSCKNVG